MLNDAVLRRASKIQRNWRKQLAGDLATALLGEG